MVLRKFSLKVSWVYLIIKQVFPTEVSPMMTTFIRASNVSAIVAARYDHSTNSSKIGVARGREVISMQTRR